MCCRGIGILTTICHAGATEPVPLEQSWIVPHGLCVDIKDGIIIFVCGVVGNFVIGVQPKGRRGHGCCKISYRTACVVKGNGLEEVLFG